MAEEKLGTNSQDAQGSESQELENQQESSQEQEPDWQAKYEAMRAHSREWEKKAQKNQEAADELEKLKAEQATEQEKATARAEKAEAELKELKAKAKRQELVTQIASATKIPFEVVSMLNGKDSEELEAQVARLLKLLPAHPTRTDDGGSKTAAKKTNADRLSDALFGK